MNDQLIRIGIIGAGNIGSVHIEHFQQSPDLCAVVAIADVNEELAKNKAEQYQIPYVYSSIDRMISSPEIDAVIICVPNKFHAPIAIQALNEGKHVMLEKPMAIDLASARDIMKASLQAKGTFMVAHQMRFEAVPMQIKERLDGGELGKIYSAKTGWLRRKGIPGWGTWFTQRAESGGGPLIDIGVHMLDLSLYLMGNPKPIAVSGSTYAEFGPRRRGIGSWGQPNWDGFYDVEDLATAFIRMDNGSTLTLDVSWAVHMETDSAPYVHLMGTEGGANYRGDSGKILTERDDEVQDVILQAPQDDEGARLRMSRHFLEAIHSGTETIIPAISGFTTNLILDAIYRSSQLGREIELDWQID